MEMRGDAISSRIRGTAGIPDYFRYSFSELPLGPQGLGHCWKTVTMVKPKLFSFALKTTYLHSKPINCILISLSPSDKSYESTCCSQDCFILQAFTCSISSLLCILTFT